MSRIARARRPDPALACAGRPRPPAAALALCLAALLLLAGPAQTARTTEPLDEYAVKAAFLVNFGGFVSWPAAAFPSAQSPFGICVLGEDPYGDAFVKFARQHVAGRPLALARITSPAEAPGRCQILFVAASEGPRLPEILRQLRGAPVLSVSDLEDFTRTGGMVQFVVPEGRIRFRINREAAESAGLRLDARLLQLAQPAPQGSLTGAW